MVTILLQKILDLLKAKLGLINTTPETASGAEVVFDTDKELPLDVLKATITASQESGTPTPEDPKAITGYDSVVITQKDGTDTTVNEITVALGNTYYGGVLDVINGTATIDKALIIFDGSEDEGWVYSSSYNGFSIPIADMVSGNQLNGLCNWLEQVSSSANFGFRLGANNRALYCYHITDNISGVTDLATWKIYLSNNNLQIVYPLATPITLSGLTPDNITTINGTNKLSANCGDLEVEYRVSTKSIISYKDLSSDLTINTECIEEASADVRAYRQGNLVYVQIQNLKYTVMPEETAVIITGLPKPKLATNAAVADGYDLERCIRYRVNTDGELQQWYCRPAGNHVAVGGFVYITDEV